MEESINNGAGGRLKKGKGRDYVYSSGKRNKLSDKDEGFEVKEDGKKKLVLERGNSEMGQKMELFGVKIRGKR